MKTIYLIIALSAAVYAVSFAFGEYIEMKRQNLEVVKTVTSCARSDFSAERIKECATAAKKNYIFQDPAKSIQQE